MWIILTIFACLLEGLAFWIVDAQSRQLTLLGAFFLLHAGASWLMAYAQSYFLSPLYQSQKRGIVIFLALLSFIVPILGIFFSWLIAIWGFEKARHIQEETAMENIDPQMIAEGFPITRRIFGEGSLVSLLQSSYVPSSTKIKALSILAQIKTASSMDMIRKTLSDSDDEVRLVGFSMIDNSEKAMNAKINELLKLAEKAKEPKEKAHLHKELAFSYWELLYQGLVDAQLSHYIEKDILTHIAQAKTIFKEDPTLYKLEGRLLFLQTEYHAARNAFVKAIDYGIRKAEVASYMAEISFLEQNYSRVPYWMDKISRYSLDYQLLNLSAVWRQNP